MREGHCLGCHREMYRQEWGARRAWEEAWTQCSPADLLLLF